MATLGSFLLMATLVVSAYAIAASIAGARRGSRSLVESGVVREAYDLNVPILVTPGEGGQGSLFSLDAENIVIEAVKPAEDGSADVILRLYEAKRMATRCALHTSLAVKGALQTDMTEAEQMPLACADGQIALDFRPFEIKTVRLQLQPGP